MEYQCAARVDPGWVRSLSCCHQVPPEMDARNSLDSGTEYVPFGRKRDKWNSSNQFICSCGIYRSVGV